MRSLIIFCSLLFANLLQSQELKVIDESEVGQNVILKGQLFDKESNESIPFGIHFTNEI